MRVKIFLVLLLCALQQVYGSNSTKKKGENRFKKWTKCSLIALAVNYGGNGKPQAAEPNSLACKYNVPDQNAGVMMNFVMCAKDQDFANRYMFDNSENCPKLKELYKKAQSGKCAFKTPKNIFGGALARFRGEQLSHARNVEMLTEYFLSNPAEYGALFKSKESVSAILHEWDSFPKKDFDFFQFTSLLKLTKIAHPDNTYSAVVMALQSEYKNVNVENARKLLKLTKLAYPNDTKNAVVVALRSEYKGTNAENVRKLLEMTKLAYPNDTKMAVVMALQSEYKDTNVEHAKQLLDLTKLAYPDKTYSAVVMALQSKYKNVNVKNARKLLELTKLAHPNDTYSAVVMALQFQDANVEHAKKLYELTKLAFPDDASKAVLAAMHSEFKDVNAENAKRVLELTKLVYSNDTKKAAALSLIILSEYEDVNVDNAKKVLELTKLAFPNNKQKTVVMALQSRYKYLNVENAKRVLEFTKRAYPDLAVAVREALKPKYKDFNVDKANKKYQKLKNSWSWYLNSEQRIVREVLKVTNEEVVNRTNAEVLEEVTDSEVVIVNENL